MLILASGSPRRKQLLDSIGISFRILVAQVDEVNDISDPRELVETNAQLKAIWAARKNPDSWVLGSDTTVALGDEILNKPTDLSDARNMLKRMSGHTHCVYTAVYICYHASGVHELFTVISKVTFKAFDDDLITDYFKIVNPLDKAGGYGIQEGKELIIDRWEGSYSNIMGLPVDEVRHALEKHSIL